VKLPLGVSVTLSVAWKTAVHDAVAGEAHVPPGCGATEKATWPVPTTDNVSVWFDATGVNVAVTEWLALIARAQLPLPVQSPLQPEKVHPVGAVAVSVTLSEVR
jgi:hypothetical protein